MLCCFAVSVFLSFVHSQRQAGDCFRDDPDTGVDRGKLDCGVCVDWFPGAAGAEVEGWRGADAVLGLIPRTEQGGKWIPHILSILSKKVFYFCGHKNLTTTYVRVYISNVVFVATKTEGR